MPTILQWEDVAACATGLETLVPELCNASTVSLLRTRALDSLSTDLHWTSSLLSPANIDALDIPHGIAERLLLHYSHLRVFHACRPSNIQSYLDFGLRPMNPDEIHHELRRIFNNKDYPEITEQMFSDAIARDTSLKTKQGRVFFELNSQVLVDHAPHYFKYYGGEYLSEIAKSISPNRGYAAALEQIGSPKILSCNLPMRWIPYDGLYALVGSLIATYFRHRLDRSYTHPQAGDSYSFDISQGLPPNLIVHIAPA